jgi:hypothetical protein
MRHHGSSAFGARVVLAPMIILLLGLAPPGAYAQLTPGSPAPSCERLASASLPNTAIAAAQLVAAGAFTPPGTAGNAPQAAFADLPAFRRVVATARSLDSDVKFEERMSMSLSRVAGALCIASLFWGDAAAQQAPTLTGQDHADIQALVARYQTALSTCASQEYASLFVPDGVFISDDFRGKRHREMYGPNGGKLVGRAKLAELVDTEDFCLDKTRKRASGPGTPPNVAIVPAPGGARGTIELANNGRYEDEYVKTSEGWRFKVRRVIMPTRPVGGGEK